MRGERNIVAPIRIVLWFLEMTSMPTVRICRVEEAVMTLLLDTRLLTGS